MSRENSHRGARKANLGTPAGTGRERARRVHAVRSTDRAGGRQVEGTG
jgi:hypothetical protein